jgi:cytochrome c-type biogenesis protein CcmH
MTAARKWAPWVVLIAVAVAVLAVGVQRGGGPPSLQAQEQRLGSQIRCPVCNGETVDQSQAAPSVEIRNKIHADLLAGQKPDQILASIVGSYGPGILEKPPARGISLLVWVIPVVAVVSAVAGLLLVLRRWRRSASVERDALVERDAFVEADDRDGAAFASLSEEPSPAADVPGPTPAAIGRQRRSHRARILVAATGVVLVAGGASWAVAASSGTRLPGQEITGQSLGATSVAADLQNAENAQAKNDVPGAVKEYQKVLLAEPDQVQALTGEGWLLAETGQPSLLQQGLDLLARAEKVQPGYAPAHVYRGIALLGERNYAGSIPELEWYLGHSPDPQLVSSVQRALAQAKTGAAATTASPGSSPVSSTG